METKRCSKCGEVKAVTEFSKNKSKKDGLCDECKACKKARDKAYYEANRKKVKARSKAYREANQEKTKARRKAYYEANKERVKAHKKAYYEANKEKENARSKAYYEANKKKENARSKAYQKKRRRKDPFFALKRRLRCRTGDAFRMAGYKKNTKTEKTLGAPWKTVAAHIESQFGNTYSWDNRDQWDIDHIKPICLATSEEELIQLCHYTNLRPLWEGENKARPSDGSDLSSPWPRTP